MQRKRGEKKPADEKRHDGASRASRASATRLLADADDAQRLADQVWTRLELAKQQLADGVAPERARDSLRIYYAAWVQLVAERRQLLEQHARSTARDIGSTEAAERAA